MKKAGIIWIAILCLIASSLSSWLTVEKLAGRIDTLAGCGAGSGCANVLGSKWSMVLGIIPVSVFSLLVYLVILISLKSLSPLARNSRILAAWLCIWAAIWFTGLQFFILKTICPYCMFMHSIGLILGISILLFQKYFSKNLIITALIMVVGLAMIQHWGPEPATHQLSEAKNIVFDETSSNSASAGRIASFYDGKKQYALEALPHLGPPNAKHIIVKYFDYTCEACQEVHRQLKSFMEQHPNDITVIMLPVPLNHACNPHLPAGAPDHENACELAILALKVWKAQPEVFQEFHDSLFEFGQIPYEAAEALAESLTSAEALAAVPEDWVQKTMQQSVADYKAFSKESPVMPKLLLPGSVLMQGKPKNQKAFEDALNQQLDFK